MCVFVCVCVRARARMQFSMYVYMHRHACDISQGFMQDIKYFLGGLCVTDIQFEGTEML